MLVPGDEATYRIWAAQQGFQLDVLDRDASVIPCRAL
jgi:hypothetical protein